MNTFKLFVLNLADSRTAHIVRVPLSEETYQKVREANARTGYDINQICAQAVEYAMQQVEYVVLEEN